MAFLHRNCNDETLAALIKDKSHRARIAEFKYDEYVKKANFCYSQFDVPPRVKGEMKTQYKKLVNISHSLDKLEEERWWRDNRDAVIADYEAAGYTLRFICISGDREYETEVEALSEARFQHAFNDVQRSYGPDGAGVDDMIPAEEMVQAVFVYEGGEK